MNGYMTPPSMGIGESREYLAFQDRIARVAPIERPVLIIGERGTGKELAARRIHYMSKRWDRNLVTLNCASLPASLIESELFGVEKGAYTGASATRKGRFEEADGGTLFLDEIALVPLSVQEKLLRVVEYGTFERVGSTETRSVDVRIVGATNADLKALSEEGRFKEDLLDRLSFDVLFVPPLRKRETDVLLLASFFAARMAGELGRTELPEFTSEVEEKLLSYSWPGNVRELKNTVERAVYRSEGNIIGEIETDPFCDPYGREEKGEEKGDAFSSYALDELDRLKDDAELSFLRRSLALSGGRQKEAAAAMGISYDAFRGLYRKHRHEL